jgi:hypothetical protein
VWFAPVAAQAVVEAADAQTAEHHKDSEQHPTASPSTPAEQENRP